MIILDNLANDLIQALKAKDELAVLTLRQTKTALQNAEIANNRQPLTEDQVIKIFRGEIKKRRDAIALYRQGGREELAAKEQAEINLVAAYLPPELSAADIATAVQAAIATVGATGPQDVGKVTGAAMAALKGQADGSVVSRIVRELLSEERVSSK